MTETRLSGGRNLGAVRVGDEVRRPRQPWTSTVHSVLRHLESASFAGAPRARGFDEQGRERLTFLAGSTLGSDSEWPPFLRSDDALRQVGAWLRRLHAATASYRPPDDPVWFTGRQWKPGLPIAHLDAAPWNAVWAGDTLVGFVDWDTAGPSRPEDDLAFSALTWVPLLSGFDQQDPWRRLHLLLDAYGYTGSRTLIRDALLARIERNVAVIRGASAYDGLLDWASLLERSGSEIAELPDSFWQRPVPAEFTGGGFRLELLGPQHNERDHEAWMSSIAHIRSTPGFERGWPPESGMTLEQNLADLVGHADRSSRQADFAYSVLDPATDEVIGCVYLTPAPDGSVKVSSWVTAARASSDGPLASVVGAWVRSSWPFAPVHYRS